MPQDVWLASSPSVINRLSGYIYRTGSQTFTTPFRSLVSPLRGDFLVPETVQTMAIEAPGPRDVRTIVNYCRPHDKPSYYYVACEPPAGVPAHNISNEPRSVIIRDARGKQDTFQLDVSGFQWLNHPSVEKEFVDEERIKTVYYAEVEEILKKYTDAKRVFVYGHTVRRSSDPETGPVRLTNRGPAVSGPVVWQIVCLKWCTPLACCTC